MKKRGVLGGLSIFIACYPGNAEIETNHTAVRTSTSLARDLPHTRRSTLASGYHLAAQKCEFFQKRMGLLTLLLVSMKSFKGHELIALLC